jgi:hypothetical protein
MYLQREEQFPLDSEELKVLLRTLLTAVVVPGGPLLILTVEHGVHVALGAGAHGRAYCVRGLVNPTSSSKEFTAEPLIAVFYIIGREVSERDLEGGVASVVREEIGAAATHRWQT